MSARIEIVNFALSFLGEARITSLDDGNDRSQAMKDFYYIAKDSVLEDANWSFAIKRWQPAANVTAPLFGWSYAYTIPADIHRVVAVLRDWSYSSAMPYRLDDFPEEYKAAHVIEGNEILANDNPIYCYGIRKMDDEGDFSPLFAEALGYKLAYLGAQSLAASNTKMQTALGLYHDCLRRAKTRDSMQHSTKRMRQNTLRNSR